MDRPDPGALPARLRELIGAAHVLTGERATRRYRKGYRFGDGPVLAVARPGSLVEMWRVLQACVAADCIVILQAANTGLTGGSTPDGNDYDRPVVLVSTQRLAGIRLVREGRCHKQLARDVSATPHARLVLRRFVRHARTLPR